MVTTKKPPIEDDLTRLTFWVDREKARDLKRAAKNRKVKFPAYLASLVDRGFAAERKGAKRLSAHGKLRKCLSKLLIRVEARTKTALLNCDHAHQ